MKNIKKRTKVFIGTLAIISTFFIGSVFGSEVILKFKGTNTIDEAKKLIQGLTQERNTIIDEYNKLDKVATDEIESLESNINSLTVQVETLTQERDKLQNQSNTDKQQIENINQEIKSLKAEIKRKDKELLGKDRLLEEKDSQLRNKDSKITDLENELNKANSKCKELQDVIDNVSKSEFVQSDLVKDNN